MPEARSFRLAAKSMVLGAALLPLAISTARADLDSYVKSPDPCFVFSVAGTSELPGGGSILQVKLTSQKWQGIEWQHWINLIRPEKVTHPEIALLVISGGSIHKEPPKLSGEALLLAQVAAKTGSVVAILTQVPNQPLFDHLKEDALIAHTFDKFMETKDESWPCLLPMTKSAVRAMDAAQSVVKERFSQEIRRFVVTGASKRGWTTWLTGAVDPRVVAIAPMVIDTLNMSRQMALQVRSFGTYSEEIKDYTVLKLPERMGEPGSKRLLELVDPYSYLKRLTMPKLILLGTNDRYWPVDAVKLYFGDLLGEKFIHYVPNAGHGLRPEAAETVLAFYKTVIDGQARPRFTWSLKIEAGEAALAIAAQDGPEKVELWKATSGTRDFREARWASSPVEKGAGGGYQARVQVPAEGFAAFFADLTYKSPAGGAYTLSTNVEVVGEKPLAKK
jgi:PhoPQ-activated pathogenicity-related protein